jgi:beta-galactosidase GanA
MIVDGKPYLALAGELANTASSDLETMKTVWPMLANNVHLNTVLTGMAWSWIEPQEGKYDFTIADAAIESARRNNLHIAWLWFASWKNGLSSFVPGWAKANQERFPRAQVRDGKTVEVLSTLSENNWQADARAFAALMRHVRETDKTHRVIMVQIENEVGLLGDSRDRSPLAEAASFARCGKAPGSRRRGLGRRCSAKGPRRRTRSSWAGIIRATSTTWRKPARRNIPSPCT